MNLLANDSFRSIITEFYYMSYFFLLHNFSLFIYFILMRKYILIYNLHHKRNFRTYIYFLYQFESV
jgi:hypothetical protein